MVRTLRTVEMLQSDATVPLLVERPKISEITIESCFAPTLPFLGSDVGICRNSQGSSYYEFDWYYEYCEFSAGLLFK